VSLLQFTDKGIYCPQADVYLDPWKPVNKALITHGHSDHARWGHQHYLCTDSAKPVIQYRLNPPNIQTVKYGEVVSIQGVNFSFHPAGHVPGSAQIRIEYRGEVWVFTGDFKLQSDGISEPFELVKCNTLIMESTFGLPIYHWQKQQIIFDQINAWWRSNKEQHKVTILSGYALGKAQRILKNIDSSIGKIFVHGAIESINRIVRHQGINLPDTHLITKETTKKDWEGALILCPPSALGSPWIRKFFPYSVGIASGWMALRGTRRRRGADRGFALSDHADWDELNKAVKETGAEKFFVTHGYAEVFSHWLQDNGLDAQEVKTQYEGEVEEATEEDKLALNEDNT
jgi:putative mRNA 3-end processing factor